MRLDGRGRQRVRRIQGRRRPSGPSKFVEAAPRLAGDLEALKFLTASAQPPRRRIRSATSLEVHYGFGDASAAGLSST
jgi:hypothetical protein